MFVENLIESLENDLHKANNLKKYYDNNYQNSISRGEISEAMVWLRLRKEMEDEINELSITIHTIKERVS